MNLAKNMYVLKLSAGIAFIFLQTNLLYAQQNIRQQIVRLMVGGFESGAGIIVGSEGTENEQLNVFIITAYHVVKGEMPGEAQPIKVWIYGHSSTFRGEVLQVDSLLDIALLRTRVPQNLPIKVVDNFDTDLNPQDQTICLGHPVGYDWEPAFAEIKSLAVEGDNRKMSLTNVNILPGYSGGGVFNVDSQLVGMIVQVTPVSTLCIKIFAILELLEAWQVPLAENPEGNLQIEGVLLDASSSSPVEGVSVYLKTQDQFTHGPELSREDGRYRFDLSRGYRNQAASLRFEKDGYYPKFLNLAKIRSKHVLSDLSLSPVEPLGPEGEIPVSGFVFDKQGRILTGVLMSWESNQGTTNPLGYYKLYVPENQLGTIIQLQAKYPGFKVNQQGYTLRSAEMGNPDVNFQLVPYSPYRMEKFLAIAGLALWGVSTATYIRGHNKYQKYLKSDERLDDNYNSAEEMQHVHIITFYSGLACGLYSLLSWQIKRRNASKNLGYLQQEGNRLYFGFAQSPPDRPNLQLGIQYRF